MSAAALLQSNGKPSAETTKPQHHAVYAVGVLRVDVLARNAGASGRVWQGGPRVRTLLVGQRLGQQLRGHSWGTHFALGGMLLLDALDETRIDRDRHEWASTTRTSSSSGCSPTSTASGTNNDSLGDAHRHPYLGARSGLRDVMAPDDPRLNPNEIERAR